MNGLNSYDPDFRCKVTDSKDQLKTKQKDVQSRQTASNKNLKKLFYSTESSTKMFAS